MRLTVTEILGPIGFRCLLKKATLLLSIATFGCVGQQTDHPLNAPLPSSFIFGEGESAWVIDFQYSRSARLLAQSGTILHLCDTVDVHCLVANGWLLAPKRCSDVRDFVNNGAIQRLENISVVPIAMGRNSHETIFQGERKAFTYSKNTYQGFQGYVYNQKLGIVGLIISTEDKIRGSSAQIDRVGLLRETRWITNSTGLFSCNNAHSL